MKFSNKRGIDYGDRKAGKGLGKGTQSAKVGVRASAWERLASRGDDQSFANRDVHGKQQISRGEREEMLTNNRANVMSVIAGVSMLILVWLLAGLIMMGYDFVSGGKVADRQRAAEISIAAEAGVPGFGRHEQRRVGSSAMMKDCYFQVDAQGNQSSECQRSSKDVVRPQWHIDAGNKAMAERGIDPATLGQRDGLGSWLGFGHVSMMRVLLALIAGVSTWLGVRVWALRRTAVANLSRDVTDINEHENDQHIALPEEIFADYGHFPDVGAHCSGSPSSLMGHVMLSNDGVEPIMMAQRYDKDVLDEHGEVSHYRGELILDERGEPVRVKTPMFDTDLAQKIFNTSGVPNSRKLRRSFAPGRIPYNPNQIREMAGGGKPAAGRTWAERINKDWMFPDIEPTRPAGAYIIDERPVNTMVLAMTRAGKGQTYIEPMIDMWSRQLRPDNMVVNDPKGELLVKNYVRLSTRGYQVVQFNLINPNKTDVYNPLAMAVQSAREGSSAYVATYVENIAEVFFPVDGADDPVWPNAANNAFKRAAYGMIDFYMEAERELRKRAVSEGWDQKVLDTRLDDSWGRVTLYNCYQLFVQLSAKKLKDPATRLDEEVKSGVHGDVATDPEASYAVAQLEAEAKEQRVIWRGEPELDMLTLYFNATDELPKNSMRDLVANADNALRSMGAAEKMLASVYGIAITAMSFFVDPTISRLTSGKLSQNVDLTGLSFPRRFGVRLDQDYLRKYALSGSQVKWDCFATMEDMAAADAAGDSKGALNPKVFSHDDTVSSEGWARAFFEGIFDQSITYLRLRLIDDTSGTLIRTLFFRFTKGFQTNLTGRVFFKDPVLGTKIVKDGTMVELIRDADSYFVPGNLTFDKTRLNIEELTTDDINSGDTSLIKTMSSQRNAVMSMQVNYAEKPKAVFLVTPPHLMKYAKLILILLKQLVDLNFDKSYLTKDSQKPLYKTRYMLDELGNLQSEGNGIAGFETMLSIGLGQEQQFTLILQTLQQLKDVYGDSVDKIVQGNVSNIIFLKSTDETMIETLSKLSGETHEVNKTGKTLTQDVEKVMMQTEGKVSVTYSTEKVPVISYNDLAFLPERNSVIIVAGKSPIWNRNEMILPMSFALFGGSPQDYQESETIAMPGKTFTLQTIPTLSEAKDFDVRLNQPNFFEMVEKRIMQGSVAASSMTIFREAYDLDDFQLSRLDPDVVAAEVMDINDVLVSRKLYDKATAAAESESYDELAMIYGDEVMDPGPNIYEDTPDELDPDELLALATKRTMSQATNDERALAEQRKYTADVEAASVKRYAGGRLSSSDLVSVAGGHAMHGLDAVFAMAFDRCWKRFDDDAVFILTPENGLAIRRADGTIGKTVIAPIEQRHELETAAEAQRRGATNVVGADSVDLDSMEAASRYKIADEFYRKLAELPSWSSLADGDFEERVIESMAYSESA